MTESPSPNLPGAEAARRIFAVAGPRRKAQLATALLLTIAGALAELVTVGAVLPLLAIASNSGAANRIPFVYSALARIASGLGVSMLQAAAIALAVAAIVATVIKLILIRVSANFVFGLMQDLVMAVFRRLIRQPYLHFVQQNSATMLAALDKISDLSLGVVAALMLAASSAFTAVCLGAMLLWIDTWTALVAFFSLGVIYAILMLVTRDRLKHISANIAAARSARIQAMQESLGGLRDILLDRSQPVFERNMEQIEDRFRRNLIGANSVQLAPRPVVEGGAVVLVAVLALWLSANPGGLVASIPMLGAIAVGAQRLLPLVQALYHGWSTYSVNAISASDVAMLLDTPIEEQGAADSTKLPFRRAIQLAGVSFDYSGGRAALSGIDLEIRRGETIGIIGKTGSGKSTLVDLLMGLLPPTSGKIMVDGRELTTELRGAWRAQLAHVPQAIFLIDGTIADNVAFGFVGHDLTRAEHACAQAGLSEFITSLPLGLSTPVGERGIRLSGGQRQRIGIARALYKQASVLILDEATSSLDQDTEREVMQSLDSLGGGLTVILVTHRLTTVSRCDRIYRLAEGKMVQQGSYEEVIGVARTRKSNPA
jgi:ATP-binding cassette subfamily B protein